MLIKQYEFFPLLLLLFVSSFSVHKLIHDLLILHSRFMDMVIVGFSKRSLNNNYIFTAHSIKHVPDIVCGYGSRTGV